MALIDAKEGKKQQAHARGAANNSKSTTFHLQRQVSNCLCNSIGSRTRLDHQWPPNLLIPSAMVCQCRLRRSRNEMNSRDQKHAQYTEGHSTELIDREVSLEIRLDRGYLKSLASRSACLPLLLSASNLQKIGAHQLRNHSKDEDG